MNQKNKIIVLIQILLVFGALWMILIYPEAKKANFNINNFDYLFYFRNLTLLLLSFSTSFIFINFFLKEQTYFIKRSAISIFPIFSITLILWGSDNILILGLEVLIFSITSLFVSYTFIFLLKMKFTSPKFITLFIRTIKIIFCGLIAFCIQIFSLEIACRNFKHGESGLFLYTLAMTSGFIVFIISILFNTLILIRKKTNEII